MTSEPNRTETPSLEESARLTVGSGKRIHLGISTCPNDTFAFAGLIDGMVPTGPFEFVIDLLDIDELNQGLLGGRFDVMKASYHAALLLADEITVLPVGSALGFGVGPLLLAARQGEVPERQTTSPQLTLCPGEHTTAKLLFDLFHGQTTRVEHVVFSEIIPRLMDQSADFGVCIHEGRFTFQESGLHCVEDLGQRWEAETDCPLPLGGLFMRDAHDKSAMREVSAIISASLNLAQANPAIALPSMRKFAQSMNDDVLMQHVDLYVNDWTVDLRKRDAGDLRKRGVGEGDGLLSLAKLSEMAKKVGKLKVHSQGLRVLHQ